MEIKFSLETIIFYVQNVDRVKYFYKKNFNLKVIEEYQSIWALLDAGTCKIGLHKIGDEYLNENNEEFKFDNNTKIVFEINNDLTAIRDCFISQNVIMREIKNFNNYQMCDGEDPEGNVFQLKQRIS